MSRRARLVVGLVSAALIVGCSATSQQGDEIDLAMVSSLSLSEIEARVHPYDLSGPTARGLALLDAWLTLERPDRDEGCRLRADTTLDLWVYAQIAAGVDDVGAGEARALLASRLEPVQADSESPAPVQQTLRESIVASVAEDLAEAGVDAQTAAEMSELAAFDLGAADAPERFSHWRESSESARVRLILSALLFRASSELEAESARGLLGRFPWLCASDEWGDSETLAEQCGYYCSDLPEAPDLGPVIERDVYDLTEDDTPVDVEVVEGTGRSDEIQETYEQDELWVPTPGDVGYELVQACGAEYFGLPPEGGVVLLSPANYLDLIILTFVGELLAGLEQDLLQGDPLTVLSSPILAAFSDHFLSAAIPQDLTPAALRYDARMELPRAAVVTVEPVEPEMRLAVVSSDRLALALAPRIRLERHDWTYDVVYAELAQGLHYPGATVIRFPRLNRIDPDLVETERLPLLRSAVGEMESAITELEWDERDDDEAPDEVSDCGVRSATGISVLVDGATYFSTLRPVLGTLMDCGYEPIRLHTYHEESSRLVDLAFDLVAEAPNPHHALALRNGTNVFTPAPSPDSEPDSDGDTASDAEPSSDSATTEPLTVGRTQEAPLLTLVDYIQSGISTGALDPSTPLVLVIEDERVDFGMLAQVVLAVSHMRQLEGLETDGQLMEAPAQERDGQPVALFPGLPMLVIE